MIYPLLDILKGDKTGNSFLFAKTPVDHMTQLLADAGFS